jgi:hypothetical protein
MANAFNGALAAQTIRINRFDSLRRTSGTCRYGVRFPAVGSAALGPRPDSMTGRAPPDRAVAPHHPVLRPVRRVDRTCRDQRESLARSGRYLPQEEPDACRSTRAQVDFTGGAWPGTPAVCVQGAAVSRGGNDLSSDNAVLVEVRASRSAAGCPRRRLSFSL